MTSVIEATDQSQSSDIVLSLEGITKSYQGVQAVTDARLEIPRGEIIGLIGPNGAGKSTLVGMIGGALIPDAGEITFEGQRITRSPAHQRARAGLMRTYQLSSEFKRMTTFENLMGGRPEQRGERFRVLLQGRRSWRDEEAQLIDRAATILERLNLNAKRDELAGNLSGGEKRLVELGRALMSEPVLILLDEPTAGVNPTFVGRIAQYLEQLRDEGLTMLLVEHELEFVERLCNSVVAMSRGRTIARGSMKELRNVPEVRNAYLVG